FLPRDDWKMALMIFINTQSWHTINCFSADNRKESNWAKPGVKNSKVGFSSANLISYPVLCIRRGLLDRLQQLAQRINRARMPPGRVPVKPCGGKTCR